MGKGPDAAKGGGVVAIEDLKVTKVPRSRCRAPRSARDLRQVRNSHKSVLAGECQRAISVLGLRDAENPMRSGVVYRAGTSIVDHQPPGLRHSNLTTQVQPSASWAGNADRSIRNHHVRKQAALPQRTNRSEEHTSELQSRGHLVCR